MEADFMSAQMFTTSCVAAILLAAAWRAEAAGTGAATAAQAQSQLAAGQLI